MQITTQVIKPANDISLISLYEAKVALKLTDESNDDMIEDVIRRASDQIATLCNRVFAKETLTETFREIASGTRRLFLTHWPVRKDPLVITENGAELVNGTDYEVDARSGTLFRLNSTWSEPVVVSYTGGYLLPFEAPDALRQAVILYSREAYYAATRGDASVRMISHKDARIIYFDPNAANRAMSSAGASGGSAAERAAQNLLRHYTRYEI